MTEKSRGWWTTYRGGLMAATLFAFLVFIPRLWSFGLWDPQEITVADQARQLANHGDWLTIWGKQLPLTTWLIAAGTEVFGPSEFGARLPLALMALLGAISTYLLGARLRRPRAGLFAAIALASSPLFLFQARQLTSDIGTVSGGALAMLGLTGLFWPADNKRKLTSWIFDGLATVIGLFLGLTGGGLLIGVVIPLGAAAMAAATAVTGRFSETGSLASTAGKRDFGRLLFAIIACVATFAIIVTATHMIYAIVDAQPGQRAVLGKTVSAAKDYLPLVGGFWHTGEPAANSTFDYIIEQVGFGMFPWSALAMLAVLRLGFVRRRDRDGWAGLLVVGWALVAYVVSALWVRKVGDLRFPGLPAIALALGFMVDDLFAAKLEGDDSRAPNAALGLPIAALFVFIAGVIITLDNQWFPEELASIHLLGKSVKFPVEVHVLPVVIVFGGLFAAFTALALHLASDTSTGRRKQDIVRIALWGIPGTTAAFALFLSWIYTPALSQHLSYKNLFESYFDHRRGDEALGVMGIPGAGPEFYSHGKYQKLDTIPATLEFLRAKERAFAIVPIERMCSIHEAQVSRPTEVHIIDRRNSRFLLLTNQLAGDEKDLSPLPNIFHTEAPASIRRPVGADFEGVVQLIGVDMPDQVEKGEHFKMTLWFKVLKRPTMNYKIFLHFDGPGLRFQGDHDPETCGATSWMPGDIVSDTAEVEAGQFTAPRATYTLFFGLYTGGNGVYKNMTVTTPNHDSNNRVNLGTLQVN